LADRKNEQEETEITERSVFFYEEPLKIAGSSLLGSRAGAGRVQIERLKKTLDSAIPPDWLPGRMNRTKQR
jgi:hypothetical protein